MFDVRLLSISSLSIEWVIVLAQIELENLNYPSWISQFSPVLYGTAFGEGDMIRQFDQGSLVHSPELPYNSNVCKLPLLDSHNYVLQIPQETFSADPSSTSSLSR